MIPGRVHSLIVERPPHLVQAALPRVVEGWGGTLTEIGDASTATSGADAESTATSGAVAESAATSGAGGGARLELPVLAGLRRGRLGGSLRVEPAEAGSTVSFGVESVDLRINLAACMILLLSAAGAVTSMAWPWFPRLLPAVPLGLVLAVGGWLLIAARLRTSGPEEFLAAVRRAALEPDEGAAAGD